MGDSRFAPFYARVEGSVDPAREIRALSDEGVVSALAWASKKRNPVLANVLATEALNRLRRATTVTTNLGEGVLGLDLAGRVSFLNPAAKAMLGWDVRELEGEKLHDLVHPGEDHALEDASELCEILASQTAPSGIVRGEDVFHRESGDEVPVAFTLTPIVRENVADGIVMILRDLTAEKATQATLARQRTLLESAVKSSIRGALETKKTKDRFRAILESTPDAMIITNTEGRINLVNARTEELFGRDREHLLGSALADLVPDHAQAEVPRSTPRESAGALVFGIHALGHKVPIEVRTRALDTPSGAIIVYVIRAASAEPHFWDRTDARRAQLTRLNATIPDAISIVDRDRRIEFANSAFAELTDRSQESLKGLAFSPGALTNARDAPAIDSDMTRLFDALERRELREGSCDFVIETEDGRARYYGLRARPLETRDGVVDGFAVDFKDATSERARIELARSENAELERRVSDRTRELALANQELEAFSYSVSHDLRAPLRAIEYLGGALREDCAAKLDGESTAYLDRIQDETRRLTQLITDLLNLSRITRGDVQRVDVDLAAIAREVVEELRASAPERDVEVVIPRTLPARGDPRLLRVVLANIIGNAWKFTATTPQAHIEFQAAPGGGTLHAYVVRDNGVGFSPAVAKAIFTPFERASDAHDFDGTGIGLATVQRIIARHGGRVWAEGSVGRGAALHFTL